MRFAGMGLTELPADSGGVPGLRARRVWVREERHGQRGGCARAFRRVRASCQTRREPPSAAEGEYFRLVRLVPKVRTWERRFAVQVRCVGGGVFTPALLPPATKRSFGGRVRYQVQLGHEGEPVAGKALFVRPRITA